ncbi:class IV lanthionine synthetase LanL [Actinomadura algeriensis]|uniref:non-specific serine/threonine protein kinase n=1 Tax=Actinomadura algeriensis TaxID=1679523 RepID=A0ABR9K1L1_9ACTN|nr:class IV lanthionine synthetase LanL [Actinomadura algeriensis]MBE1536723.1 tRNA A-37 threonylcarbamoyl transferase component Bud32 [Actinomadura algeriensis]
MVDFKFSVFTAVSAADAGEAPLVDVLTRAVAAAPGRWRVGRSGSWCSVVPQEAPRRPQGWKLHVSATPASAEDVLGRALRVLLAAGSAFKFAATVDFVAALNARNTSRGHSGKFITVYPESDAEAVRLARELHEATKGLAGPRVLSDRPYAPDSLVHYRYGAFVEERRLTNDGFYAWTILDPDGRPVEDRRVGRYTPPSWVTSPFPDNGMNGTRRTRVSGEITLGGRFAVREAIRHSNKGGVYRAVDRRTGDPVVIKEARPHVAADMEGRDTRDRLRAEAGALERLGGRGLAPRLVELFTQSGHLFLAQEMVQGGPLREWTAEHIVDAGWGGHLEGATEMARRLVGLMGEAHAAGLLIRDFNPNNIMVRPDGTPVLIDLELAVVDGEGGPLRAGTPAFGAPEQLGGAPPHASADHYSLGATLCYLFTGGPPYLLDEFPESRPLTERLEEWLTARMQGLEFPEHLRAMLLGLMADDPGHRWTTARARDALADRSPRRGGARDDGETPWLRETVEQAIEGITGELLASMNPDAADALWPVSCVHGAPDPCTLQQGAAGCLGALVRCSLLTGDPRLPDAIAAAAGWIRARLADGTNRPPGLYFGTAGVAWSLLDAGLALGDERLVEDAVAVAGRLPSAVASPDVTHGTAGLGLTALHLWARTGSARFAESADAAADALLRTVEERAGGLVWSTPADVDSKLAGRSYYGFAHGIAGVGCFLLACAEATGRDDCRAFALRVGEELLDAAVVERGTAMWGAGAGDAPTAPYWCHGASGIGSFLVRLGAATGDARFLEAADLAARAVAGHAWRAVLGQCHGLSGNGDFLLDMAELTGDDRHRTAAWRLGRTIVAARARRDGRFVLPDEQGEVSATWGDGMSGMLGFLLRLRYGSPRLWTVDAAAAITAGGAS